MIKKFTKEQANLFTFFRFPYELLTNPKYEGLSILAMVLYGLLLDRNSLSQKNGWVDKKGYIYIYYSREEVERTLKLGKDTVIKLFAELRNFDLIEEVRQGLGKPNRIYVGQFLPQAIDNQEISDNLQNSEKSSSRTLKNRVQNSKKSSSETRKNRGLKLEKIDPNHMYLDRPYSSQIEYTHTAVENSDKVEVIASSKTEGVCVNNTPSKINEMIQEPQTKQDVEGVQKEIKEVTGQQITVKKIRELLGNSSVERIRYHLANWHIHKEHQKSEGAGWFFTVIEHDIAPEKKITGGTGEKNGNIPLKDNFKQREYTPEQYKAWENAYMDDLDKPESELKEKNKPEIPYILRKGYI